MPNIRIDREVYRSLQRRAEPFVDTPNGVLRRLLGLDPVAGTPATAAEPGGRPEPDAMSPEPARGSNASRLKPKGRARKSRRRARRADHKPSPRVPPGVLLPEEAYTIPLLSSLAERGGSAPARETIEWVGKKLEGKLTPADKGTNSSGVIRWQNRVQFVRLKLVEEGLLARDSPRGVWALTEMGRSRLNGSG